MSSQNNGLISGVVLPLLVLIVSPFIVSRCHDEAGTVRILEAQGYTNVVTDGRAWFSCGKDDVYQTKFEATSPAGKRVTGAVCAGWWKDSTIRFN